MRVPSAVEQNWIRCSMLAVTTLPRPPGTPSLRELGGDSLFRA